VSMYRMPPDASQVQGFAATELRATANNVNTP
jgi:hypothetical protein